MNKPSPCENSEHREAVSRFARRNFGLSGSISLHRSAFGRDLLIAPLNVVLAPVHLLVQLAGLLAGWCGATKAARWARRCRVILPSTVSSRVSSLVRDFVEDVGIDRPSDVIEIAVADYVSVRSAVAEITTTLLVIVSGFAVFGAATPGVLSLSSPVSEMLGHASAVADFPLGTRLGGLYYRVFPVELPPYFVVAIGVGLAALASLVTTFAGVVADPLQVALGIHQRRLRRLLARLAHEETRNGLSSEHLLARVADLGDLLASVVRALRP